MHVPPGQEIQPHRDESPASRDQATGTLRSAARQVPPGPRSSERGAHGAAHTALFGGPRAELHRDRVTTPLRRSGSHVSTGSGTYGLIGARQPELFGASRAEPHPGPRTRHSSERRGQRLTGARQTALFGASRAEPHPGTPQLELFGAPDAASHRGRVTRALRSTGAPVSPRSVQLISSGNQSPAPLGARQVGDPRVRHRGCTLSHLGGGAVG